jgi:carboxymethylenebutenolidase
MAKITVNATDGGRFDVYLALPPGGSGPGLLVIQEIFGVNAIMRGVCDTYAARGYVALCPDLFWRQEPGVDISDAETDKASALMGGFSETKGVEDLIASLDTLRALPECGPNVGTLGFCLGGRLAFLMATRSDSDCNVSYYGVGIEKLLGEASAITRPLLMHIAEQDRFVPPAAQQAIREGLGGMANVTLYSYPGVGHAFARPGGALYDAHAAKLADDRTADFFALHLG